MKINQEAKSLKLTNSEFLVYYTLKKQGDMTKKQLVDKLKLSNGTIKNTMRKFKRYGFIIIYPNLNDMRTFYISLTPRAKEVITNESSRVSRSSNKEE